MAPLLLGLFAALTSTLCFGTFAVPVKSPACRSISIHPLAFQSYKTACCLLTSWVALLVPSYDDETNTWGRILPSFTAWGVVSGLFWVPGGVAAIYAVQHAGLAVAQGTWSTLIVLVSFVWGIFVFGEEVKSVPLTVASAGVMVAGLVGMSKFGVPTGGGEERGGGGGGDKAKYSPLAGDAERLVVDDDDGDIRDKHLDTILNSNPGKSAAKGNVREERGEIFKGLLAACFNGIWGGSIMVPMHYAPPEAQGLGYVISFAFGATAVTLMLWAAVWGRWKLGGGEKPPSLHFRVMWKEGFTAGTLWSIGNIASMISVQVLEEAVGYSICQSSLLVSGLWGIFYFEEVRGANRWWWGGSAVLCLGGIVGLTAMHKGDEGSSGGAGR